jgi:hypothetical protein
VSTSSCLPASRAGRIGPQRASAGRRLEAKCRTELKRGELGADLDRSSRGGVGWSRWRDLEVSESGMSRGR